MLAIVFSLAFGLFVIGPDQLSRFILAFGIPRRAVNLTRSEEIARAAIWSLGAFLIALLWAWNWGTLAKCGSWRTLETFFAGVYSEQFFRDNRAAWEHSVKLVCWISFALLWRLYLLVSTVSLLLNLVILNYAKIRYHWRKNPRRRKWLARLVLPRIAPWHLLLSRFLLHQENISIHADVLCKNGIVYQGKLADSHLTPEGNLISLTLDEPRRFKREEYLERKKKQPSARSDKSNGSGVNDPSQPKVTLARIPSTSADELDKYWKTIPTTIFVIFGAEITNINLRYVPERSATLQDPDISAALKDLLRALEKRSAEKQDA